MSLESNAAKTVIVTGGNAGLGYQCARALAGAAQGWRVVIAGRDAARTAAAAEQLARETGAPVEALQLDLASLASVRAFAAAFAARDLPPLHAIVCNAGVQAGNKLQYTNDGFEMTFGVNHLGHFLLVNLLLERLVAPARIVVVSSGTHNPSLPDGRLWPVHYRDARSLAFPQTPGAPQLWSMRRYSTSKLCNIFFAYELARRLEQAGLNTPAHRITVNAYDPGPAPDTGLARNNPSAIRRLWTSPVFQSLLRRMGMHFYTPETSGRAMARLVLDPALEGVTGRYFHVHDEAPSSPESHDRRKAAELWETSAELVGLAPDESVFGGRELGAGSEKALASTIA